MILDNRTTLSDKQAIVATAVSTNILDMLALGKMYDGTQLKRKLGKAGMIPLLIQVTEAFNNLTSLAIQIQTAEDGDAAFASPKTILQETVLLADLVEGRISPIDKIPRNTDGRYLRINYIVTGTAPTTGAIYAGIPLEVDGAYRG